MNYIPDINISEYDYPLSDRKIAQFPLPVRDESKLLIYRKGHLSQDIFKYLISHLPEDSLLIFNETKVIHARILFQKESGAAIELFCLEPELPTRELQQAFEQRSGVVWKCLVGNSKRWKNGKLIKKIFTGNKEYILTAERINHFAEYSLIRFEWNPGDISFSDVLYTAGIVPLPPYIIRAAKESDNERYQTVYAQSEGSVAAPTAGLHFTQKVLKDLKEKNIRTEKVILHVGAGTFKPVSSNTIREHEMHAEKILIHKKTIRRILENHGSLVIIVGTTTLRTIESLYWYGVKSMVNKDNNVNVEVGQWDPYNPKYNIGITVQQSLKWILEIMDEKGIDTISGQTRVMIVPSYKFRLADILITNFHMPQSTLLLLVSAFIGDQWRRVYDYALQHDFRFLSYGDACLFFKK
jgi:S-adenosylmethionine:tRNA ribosyltransferase-isomerase